MTVKKNFTAKWYLVASDFDQTLSFNDSGELLAELLGIPGFEQKVAGMADQNLVQQGAELSYLILHDPEFRKVRREDLIEAGKRIRLKQNVDLLIDFLGGSVDESHFYFYVVSAAPREVVESALEGIVQPENIFGTRFRYRENGEVESIVQSPAGYGKVAVLDRLQTELKIPRDRVIYIGDGSSDVHVMLHTNQRDGFTIAVSENRFITQIARRTVLSENAFSVAVPILEEIFHWDNVRIQALLEEYGLAIQEWQRTRTDVLTLVENASQMQGEAPTRA